MTKVLCVLRSGGDFHAGHVLRLAAQVRRHAPEGTEFVCLTDYEEENRPNTCMVSLAHDWPGWWAKLDVFRHVGPCLYFDLDVNIVGSLVPLLEVAEEHSLIMLRDFWGCEPHKYNSSVMAWWGDLSWLRAEFEASAKEYMERYRTREWYGDQAFIRDHYGAEPTLWQDVLPGALCSFKRGVLLDEDVSRCRVIVSHGVPRPWQHGGADGWLRGDEL